MTELSWIGCHECLLALTGDQHWQFTLYLFLDQIEELQQTSTFAFYYCFNLLAASTVSR